MKTRLSRPKRFAFKALIVILTLGCIELSSALLLIFFQGGIRQIWNERDNTTKIDEAYVGPEVRLDVVHPYIGFVRQPMLLASNSRSEQHVTEFGFNDVGPPLHKRAGEKVIIGILGGSVAEQFATNASDALARELSKSPKFAGRKLVFVRMALQGHKQPQQLMTISYLLTLGAEFDILINIDGFNEVALPIAENVPNHVFPCFPRSWHTKIVNVSNTKLARLIGHVTHLKFERRRNAELFASVPLRYSLTMTLLWKILHESKRRLMLKDYERIGLLARDEVSYCATGPRREFANDAELREHCVAVWSRSSRLLHQLCAANGIQYFHFLQPNQYVDESKPMGRREKLIALSTEQPYRKPVVDCYPLLIREGKSLSKQGVRFHDLTQIFADHPEPIYVDNMCHLSRQGDLILAREIGTLIRSEQD